MPRLLVAIRGRRRQVEAARLAGWTQAKISRAERGEGPPLTPAEAAHYAAVLGATPEQSEQLVELAHDETEAHQAVPRSVMLRNPVTVQGRIRRYLRDADVVRTWTTNGIPGYLQTPEWTRAMQAGEIDDDPGPEWWAQRRAQAALLNDPGRRWHVLVPEGALRWIVGSREVAAAQIRHIAEVSRLEHVRLGVIDLATPKPLVGAFGFQIFGRRAVELDTELGATFIERGEDIDYLLDQFERLAALAVYGDDAQALLERIARTLGR